METGRIEQGLAEAKRLAADDPSQAMAVLEGLLALNPDHPVVAIRLGRLRLAAGRAEQARVLADRVLSQDEGQKYALILKGQAAEAMADADGAEEAWMALAARHGPAGLEIFARATRNERAYRAGVSVTPPRTTMNRDLAALVKDGDTATLMARIDVLIRAADTPSLERLHRMSPPGPLRTYIDFRLWFRMQAYAEPLALADSLIAAPELRDRHGEIRAMAGRAALMLEDRNAIDRWLPAEDPPPPALPQRLLNAVWRSDPARGLGLARRLAFTPTRSSNAEGLYVFLPLLMGDTEQAQSHLDAVLTRHAALRTRPSIELTMAAASVAWTQGRHGRYRQAFDAYFEGFGLESPLTDVGPAQFDALGVSGLPVRTDGPLVSVIITVFNAEATLGYALGSLQAQTHANLEIIAVDDHSTDGTLGLLHAAAASDSRITVIENAENLGTYVSKNRALAQARGDYWVCHDGDDWAHPRRIERHVEVMQADPTLVATRSNWLRVDAQGMPFIRRTSGGWTHVNPGSPFYRRREVIEAVGVYDRVRIDGDLDHWRRTLDHFGPDRLAQLRQPLTLGLFHAGSLTRSGAGAQNDEHYSAPRSAYRFAGLQWRRTQVDGGDLRMTGEPGPRPFPAPAEMVVG